MSPLVREAVRQARNGAWELLDALELIERRHADERDAIATARWLGRTLIGYGREVERNDDLPECEACEGEGVLDADGANGKTYTVDCPACYGSGIDEDASFDDEDDADDDLAWRDLNGRPADAPPNRIGVVIMTYSAAKALVEKETRALETQP